MKKVKFRNWVGDIQLHNYYPPNLMLWWSFRKELSLKLVTFACDTYSYRRFKVWHINAPISFYFWRFFSKYCILSFVAASFSKQAQPQLIFRKFEACSRTLELDKAVILSERKLNRVNPKAKKVYLFVKEVKYVPSFLFDGNIL